MDSLGVIYRGLGEYDRAIEHYRNALTYFEETNDRLQVATEWTNVGDIHADLGDAEAARPAWSSALIILDDLQHPDADAVRARIEAGTAPR